MTPAFYQQPIREGKAYLSMHTSRLSEEILNRAQPRVQQNTAALFVSRRSDPTYGLSDSETLHLPDFSQQAYQYRGSWLKVLEMSKNMKTGACM